MATKATVPPLMLAGSPRGLALITPGGTIILSRRMFEAFAEFSTTMLDVFDGEPVEANGDELDGEPIEDEFLEYSPDGPGCPISDPGEPEEGV